MVSIRPPSSPLKQMVSQEKGLPLIQEYQTVDVPNSKKDKADQVFPKVEKFKASQALGRTPRLGALQISPGRT